MKPAPRFEFRVILITLDTQVLDIFSSYLVVFYFYIHKLTDIHEREIKELAKRILNVSMEAKLEGASQDYLDSVKPFLAEAIIAWCNGVSFLEVCKITDTFEGNIIRCLRRLEELLRQLVQAAKTLGNQDLEIKFNEGIRLIKRDIVFAASLYL
uniref:Superkiller viralicidic activity 2-like 2 n=1 Tax=Lygus hesperus TaxID=30085 RepID=A0A146KQ74_LYGHE